MESTPYRQVLTNVECMTLKSKIARPLDQTEKEWTNTDTMLTDDNDDKEN